MITLENGHSRVTVNEGDTVEQVSESLEGVAGNIAVIDGTYPPEIIGLICCECRVRFNCIVVNSLIVFSRLEAFKVGDKYETH